MSSNIHHNLKIFINFLVKMRTIPIIQPNSSSKLNKIFPSKTKQSKKTSSESSNYLFLSILVSKLSFLDFICCRRLRYVILYSLDISLIYIFVLCLHCTWRLIYCLVLEINWDNLKLGNVTSNSENQTSNSNIVNLLLQTASD